MHLKWEKGGHIAANTALNTIIPSELRKHGELEATFFDQYASWNRNVKVTSNHERSAIRKKMVAKGFEIHHSNTDYYKGIRIR